MTDHLAALLRLGAWGAVLALAVPLRAEVVLLRAGGRLEAELLNRERQAGEPYQLRTPKGVALVLPEAAVQRVVVKSELNKQYEALASALPNTIESHWKMAEWCKEAGLNDERKRHLQSVIALAPDHEEARKALGYSRYGSRWLTAEEYLASQGYQRYRGAWRLKQEIELEERERQAELAQKQWRRDIRRWFEQIAQGSRHADAAQRSLASINDVNAAPALAELLADGKQPRGVRLACLEILSRLPPGLLTPVLVRLAMEESDDEIRDRCLDEVKRAGAHQALPRLLAELKSKDNRRVNRAAECLERLEDKEATLALIDALVTEHEYIVSQGGSSNGGMSLSFGGGSGPGQGGLGSFGVGGKPKRIKKTHENSAVRNALATLNPGVNFNFDVAAWRRWYIESQTSTSVDLRRDGP